jgi:hypothetical protein
VREYRRLTGTGPDLKAFLLDAPDLEALGLERRDDRARTVEL